MSLTTKERLAIYKEAEEIRRKNHGGDIFFNATFERLVREAVREKSFRRARRLEKADAARKEVAA